MAYKTRDVRQSTFTESPSYQMGREAITYRPTLRSEIPGATQPRFAADNPGTIRCRPCCPRPVQPDPRRRCPPGDDPRDGAARVRARRLSAAIAEFARTH